MDWQQLPVVKGGKGFKFKVSAIHMSTRIKYSEILDDHTRFITLRICIGFRV